MFWFKKKKANPRVTFELIDGSLCVEIDWPPGLSEDDAIRLGVMLHAATGRPVEGNVLHALAEAGSRLNDRRTVTVACAVMAKMSDGESQPLVPAESALTPVGGGES